MGEDGEGQDCSWLTHSLSPLLQNLQFIALREGLGCEGEREGEGEGEGESEGEGEGYTSTYNFGLCLR